MTLNFQTRGNMNIQGVEILTQKILYSPQTTGIITSIILPFITIILIAVWANNPINKGAGIVSCFTFCLFILSLVLTMETTHSTILNKPTKIQYQIDVIDDKA